MHVRRGTLRRFDAALHGLLGIAIYRTQEGQLRHARSEDLLIRDRALVARPRAGDPPELTADPRRAGRELGWTPRVSSVDDIIGTAWRWYQRLHASAPLEGAAS